MNKRIDLLLINYLCMNRIGIFTIASFARSKGLSVKIIDGEMPEIKKEIAEVINEVEVVAVSATTDVIGAAFDICNFTKKLKPDAICVLGGFHATALPEQTLKEGRFDAVVAGEGEITMVEFVNKIKAGIFPTKTKGTIEKYKGELINNGERELISDLDILPIPAFDLVDFDKYVGIIRHNLGNLKKVAYLLVSRGCPFDCVFCASAVMWKRKLRFHSNDYIIGMIRKLMRDYYIDGVAFLDDELLVNKEKILSLCSSLKDLGIKWECQARASSVTPELLKEIKDAGCIQIRFGFESGNDKALAFLKRNTITVEQNRKAVKMCNEAGLVCHGSFIIGYPDETVESIVDTINFIETSGLDFAEVYVLIPYVGIFIYNYCLENNLLPEKFNWNDFLIESYTGKNSKQGIIRSRNFTAEQLEQIRKYIEVNVTSKTLGESGLNHKAEIEKILVGNLSKTEFGYGFKANIILRKLKTGISNPQVVLDKFLGRR